MEEKSVEKRGFRLVLDDISSFVGNILRKYKIYLEALDKQIYFAIIQTYPKYFECSCLIDMIL